MYYKECSHCGKITDEDEDTCLGCYQNPFNKKRYSQEELINQIKRGKISISRLIIKHWSPFVPYLPKEGSP